MDILNGLWTNMELMSLKKIRSLILLCGLVVIVVLVLILTSWHRGEILTPPENCTTNPESILEVFLTVSKWDAVRLRYIRVTFGKPSIAQPEPGNYSLRVLSREGEVLYKRDMHLPFIIFSDPPMPTDYETVYDKIKYDCKMYKVEFYYKDKLLFSKPIGNVCDYDGICESNENFWSCVNDCEPWANDGICNKDLDGGCDPDCLKNIDPDCRS